MARTNLTLLTCIFAGLCCAFPLAAQNLNTAAPNSRYLALGDSLAFGFNPAIQPPDLSKYIGYPVFVSQALGYSLANASCPGETSGTFAGTSDTFLQGFNCAPLRQSGLFVPYNGAPNQLQYAVNYLKSNSGVKLVTIDIGVNDLGVVQTECTEQFPSNPLLITACELPQLPAVIGAYEANLTKIFHALRATGYNGNIAFLTGYAFNYADLVQVGAITTLNQTVSTVNLLGGFHIIIADGFKAFQIASSPFGGDPCKAGLLLKKQDGTCDTHPSPLGHGLLAATVSAAVEAHP